MALTNAEKQARYRARQKPYLKVAKGVDRLYKSLLELQETLDFLFEQIEKISKEDL